MDAGPHAAVATHVALRAPHNVQLARANALLGCGACARLSVGWISALWARTKARPGTHAHFRPHSQALEAGFGAADEPVATDALGAVRAAVLREVFAPRKDRAHPDGWEHVRTLRAENGAAPVQLFKKTFDGRFRTTKVRGASRACDSARAAAMRRGGAFTATRRDRLGSASRAVHCP